MLPKKHKLNSSQFATLFKTGASVSSPFFVVKYLRNQEGFRSAVVVSKKHLKTAVGRNYKRRVVYNLLWDVYKLRGRPGETHLILILTPRGLRARQEEIREELGALLEKLL